MLNRRRPWFAPVRIAAALVLLLITNVPAAADPLEGPASGQTEDTGSAAALQSQTDRPDQAVPLPSDRTLAGDLEANAKGDFAYYKFEYPGDESPFTINLQVTSDQFEVLRLAGFNVYGPQPTRVYAKGGAQPSLKPNISGNLIGTEAGTYLVQVYSYHPTVPIGFEISLIRGEPPPKGEDAGGEE